MKDARGIRACLLGAGLTSLGSQAHAQPSFDWLPYLPGYSFSQGASAISADGSTVVGTSVRHYMLYSYFMGFRWTSGTGITAVPGVSTHSYAWGVSEDGSLIVGSSGGGLIWQLTNPATGAGTSTILNPVALSGYFRAVSADGSAAAMLASNSVSWQAFRWSSANGFATIGTLPGSTTAYPEAVSANGAVLVGRADGGVNPTTAFRWALTDPQTGQGVMTPLGILPGYLFSRATDVSGDGSVVIGNCDSGMSSPATPSVPFRWTLTNLATGAGQMTMVAIGALPSVTAEAMSSDGRVIAGTIRVVGGYPYGEGALVWTAQDGWRRLDHVLRYQYGLPLQAAWMLREAIDISADGTVIVGHGQDGPGTMSRVWVARLPSAPCYADCNVDGVLTVADFGCFQTRYVAASPYADCDADGSTTIKDFACFQSKFPLGCP